ncbi:MAG TPA: sulfatase-like hydrolase/transferase [Thermoanaerobaculia bacterium]|nr:sulfatase-like hydrolase/transferase [Thermoanaerobaculia bacterium]
MRRSLALALLLVACSRSETSQPPPARPSILLVTLDTTRADAIGPEARGIETPAFTALAARGMRFRFAYATVPQTLPSHASMLTGLYPAGHSVRENARHLGEQQPLVAERLHQAGYRTAAFVSAFALARRFGLGRGFDTWDEDFGEGAAERTAKTTTDRALAFLQQRSNQPLFLWVHYYDPHYPYTPPEPYLTRYANQPYLGEVASMDEQLGLLVQAFDRNTAGEKAIVVVGDHGEGLGEHGEQQHGNLLYQSTMHVPLLLVGPGVKAGTSDAPVSTRRIFHTILDWAGLGAENTLRGGQPELVMAEAMKPFLDYGWQPQVMAVDGRIKTILAGRSEVYDLVADPKETHDLADVPRAARAALRDYPLPTAAASNETLDEEEQRKLASLGYVASGVKPLIRPDAPRPIDMAPLYPILDRASGLFVREQYAAAIPLLEQIRKADPHNLDAALRLATAYSSLGRNGEALAAFKEAEALAPESADVKTYLALHYARGKEWQQAEPMLERIVASDPHRVPALEALAMIREREGRIPEAVDLRQRLYAERAAKPAELVRLGQMQMAIGQTEPAIASFEKARSLQAEAFRNDLELGVLYLASQRLTEARDALDRVKPGDPAYPLALFKRAQVSVLLHEQDSAARIAAARQHADGTTRVLIERERLFR